MVANNLFCKNVYFVDYLKVLQVESEVLTNCLFVFFVVIHRDEKS